MAELIKFWTNANYHLNIPLNLLSKYPHTRRLDMAGAADMSPSPPPGMKELL